ncbi:hypothetical protein L3Q82_002652 [Scortum barcoo]|uniref:Uncharacterized protein n=1 Tax=Scortum barcoo TaxID=214431 RepID=A0ACB8VUH6_9TELE|nr:hypothetical protein L3Q82_002652 [Scortum barcoo]
MSSRARMLRVSINLQRMLAVRLAAEDYRADFHGSEQAGQTITLHPSPCNMFLFNICVCAGLMLFLPQCTYQSCSEGTPKQCVEAEFAPGTNLAGEGFDITKMERKGAFVIDMNQWKRKDKTCMLCSNPYLENKKQKLPLSVEDWRAKQSCSMKVSSKLHRSSESLVSSSTSSVNNNWQTNLDLSIGNKGASFMLAGTNSKLAEYSMEKTKNDKFSFTSQSMYCEYYSYRLSGTPKLHREFRKAVKQLPKTYSPQYKQQFYKLIDSFGTHYITKVKLGGSVQSVTSIRQCQASLQGLSVEEVEMCLKSEASASAKVSVKVETQHCNKDLDKKDSKTHFSDMFNDRFTEIKGGHTTEPDILFSANKNPSAYKEWLSTVPQNPDIFTYSLDSLHELLPTKSPARKNLRSAISHYILEKGLWRNCSERCQAGIKSDPKDTCVCQCHNDPAINQDCCPARKGMARVIITVQRAAGLWGDYITATDGYVKVFFNDIMVRRTPVIYNNNNPHWGAIVDLGSQDLSAGQKVRFEVWDEDNKWDDDKLGQCEPKLSAGVKEDLCNMNHGQLFFKWEVKCAPSLSGASCTDYKPSPMSQSLKELYVSRHAQPIPKAILLEMGVFVDETSSYANQSLTAKSQKFNCTYQSCSEGTPKQCVEAEFAPGTNLAGEGFDITKMERKGAFVIDMNQWKRKDKTCTLCSNPYLENKKQKLPLSVEDWRAKHSCSMKVSSKLHRSSESLLSSSTSSVNNNWEANLDVNVGEKSGSVMLAGTHSKLAEYSMEKTKNDKFSFTSQSMYCEYYSYRLSGTPKLHREFQKAVKQLPKIYSPQYKQRFYKLIDNFGTHYITKVQLGGSVQSVTSIRQCQASLQGLSVEEVEMCLEAEASASIKVSVKTQTKHCQKDLDKMESKTSFSGLFNERFTEIKGGHTTEPDILFSADKNPSAYKEWLSTVPQNPDIFTYSLDSLHELLPTKSPARKNLRSAISHYILEKGLWRNCSERCQAGIKSDPRDTCVCQCHNDPAAVNQDCCPTRKGMARVIITVQRAADLWGDHTTATDGYVKVFFNGIMIERTPVIYNNNNPHWGAIVDLGSQDLSAGQKVRFEVWDEDNKWDDDNLGQCEPKLSAGVKEDLCNLQHGQLFFKIEVKCAPSLSGASCTDYKPSPMSQSLKELYVSRHAQPIPKAILLKMGVFVDETSSYANQSLTAKSQKFDVI